MIKAWKSGSFDEDAGLFAGSMDMADRYFIEYAADEKSFTKAIKDLGDGVDQIFALMLEYQIPTNLPLIEMLIGSSHFGDRSPSFIFKLQQAARLIALETGGELKPVYGTPEDAAKREPTTFEGRLQFLDSEVAYHQRRMGQYWDVTDTMFQQLRLLMVSLMTSRSRQSSTCRMPKLPSTR